MMKSRPSSLQTERMDPVAPTKPSLLAGALHRIRNELLLEAVIAVCLFAIGLGLTFKVIVAVAFACLKFAIPDFITGMQIFRLDSSKAHGLGVGLLFAAKGMVQASGAAFVASMLVTTLLGNVNRQQAPGWMVAGLITAAYCIFGFLFTVFPLTLLAALVARMNHVKLYFCAGLTQLRRRGSTIDPQKDWSIDESLKLVGLLSSISMGISLLALLFFVPPTWNFGPELLVFFACCIGASIWWYRFFRKSVAPVELQITTRFDDPS